VAPDGGAVRGAGALRAIFRLEAERTVHIARLGREAGAEQALEDVDERLKAALAALEAEGIAYPLHVVARQSELGQEDYLIIQLALLPYHGPEVVLAATSVLGEGEPEPRLSHAVTLLAQGFDDWERAAQDLLSLTVFGEELVVTTPLPDGDLALAPALAIKELLGLE
jgi:hypothetical protein